MSAETEGQSTGGLGHLPWQQVPRFTPGVTNVDEYSQRLKFLKELWPAEHLQHLAPRAALMVEGAAFHKISRIAPDKLRSADGVKLLVESLGGSWGKTAVEEKYHYFEQAMFQVAQKTDESNDSYISRHDAAFEELLARKVSLEEIRAYILLRHSLLSPDDKKRVVVEAKGDLKYQDTVKSIRLLGSKFFSEFQQRGSGHRGSERSKVYDVNATFEEDQSEEIHMTEDDDHDEDILVMFLNQGDEDAVYITEFEDSIVEAVQESTLAPVFTSYTEARQRLRDKAKARGYFKPKGKGIKGTAFKKGKSGHGEGFRRKSLAERIASSSCRLCGGRGHWKRECPKRDDKTETTHYTPAEYDSPFLPELTPHIPEDAVYYHEDDVEEEDGQVASAGGSRICGREHVCLTASPEVKPKPNTDFEAVFARRMLMLSRTPEWARDAARRSLAGKKAGKRPGGAVESSSRMSCQQGPGLEESILVTTAGAEGVLDTGASRTVVGSDRVHQLLQGLPADCRREVRKVKSDITFRFGNSGTLASKHALLLPASGATWVRVEIVPGNTPLLISNRLLRDLDAVIYVRKGILSLGSGVEVPLRFDERGLSIVDLASVLLAPHAVAHLSADIAQQADKEHSRSPMNNITLKQTAITDTAPEPTVKIDGEQPISSQIGGDPDPTPFSPLRDGHAGLLEQGSSQTPDKAASSRHGRAIVGARGQSAGAGDAVSPRVPGGGLRPSGGSAYSPGMEPHQSRAGQTSPPHLRGDLREGSSLRHGHGTQGDTHECLGPEFQRVQPGQTEEDGAAADQEDRGRDRGDLRPRRLEGVPDKRGDKEGQDSRAHGTTDTDRDSRGSFESQFEEAIPPGTVDQNGSRDGPRPAPIAEGDVGTRAPAPERDGASSGKRGDVRAAPNFSKDDRGKGHLDLEGSEAAANFSELCASIDHSILQIEHQLRDEVRNPHAVAHKYRLPTLDVLEVAQLGSGMIGQILRERGHRVKTLQQERDIANDHRKLWRIVSTYEPEHIWINLDRPWKRQHGPKLEPFWPEDLLRELFYHQIERGRHLHVAGGVEIFSASADRLAEVQQGMLCAIHNPSEMGKKAVPSGNNHLHKTTVVHTTSRSVQQALDTRGKHFQTTHRQQTEQQPSQGRKCSVRLADRVADSLKRDVGLPLPLEELLVGEHKREGSDSDLSAAKQVLKRRRLLGKQPPPPRPPDKLENPWARVFQMVNDRIPPKGRVYIQEGDEVATAIQELLPGMIVKHVVFCRGINRIQPALAETRPKEVPLRYTVVVKRVGGEIVADKQPEDWSRIPKYKRGSHCIPAKIALTVYGCRLRLREHSDGTIPASDVGSAQPSVVEPLRMEAQPASSTEAQPGSRVVPDARPPPEVPEIVMPEGQQRGDSSGVPQGVVQGYPPRAIPRHGPGYLDLSKEHKTELSRLHHNLGHPAVEVFVKFLQERKAEPALIRGARDYSCAACLETVPSMKPARPASIHFDGDFGDVVGMDVAYWTGRSGQQHLFTHVIDESTLFQQAVATGRTPEEQFAVLADTWFQWTGPCKVLYIDPAGEYNSDFWRLQLQREGVRANVSAGEAHWQLGRTEKHGNLLKSMLTRMDSQELIKDEADFKRCLREAVRAKNALSRVKGYTPEQAVLGKMSRVPGSLISDDNAATHALADSEMPEGVAFRRDLQRREQARVAFVRADNDCAYRRALLRRSRPRASSFEPGDWVLYWRRQRGGTRGERGRWYGPGQVVSGDNRVVYVSHCGQLIRAAPEQLRSASMREWQAITDVAQGTAQPRQLVDLAVQGEVPVREEVEQEGPPPVVVPPPVDVIIAPEGPRNSVENIEEQPEHEASPAVSETAEGEIPLLDAAMPELDAAMPEPVDIPVPEDDEDDLLFGDTECFLVHPEAHQVWEIGIHETDIEPCNLPSPTQALHYVMLATQDRKKRVEVRLRDLSVEEQEQFSRAKQKEVGAWLDHATVRKVAAGTLEDSQLMRCRWILSWKDPEKVGGPRRAKARLVVLGFEDPDLSSIPNDAPTLGKDARQLILQKVASNRWKLINFDVSTAFLQGKGDGRKLGIRPPLELRTALDMKEHDQCLLEGGAYGRVDAPFLWFQTFKETLENLGFIQCPFDACTFCLVTPKGDGVPKVHGVLGIHVDDGIGGGDGYFSKVIKELRAIYNFGSYDEGEFNFTGIHFRQWLDGSIEMDQTTYIEKIAPIHIPRERRIRCNASLTPEEVKELRRLNGSLQYAAVHTRPDLAAKVGFLQTRINQGQVHHLIEANRVLHEAKTHRVSLMIVPISEEHVTFCTFSDASFATSKDNNSYQGTLVMITDWRMLANEKAVIVPVAWCSKKIARVVRSTLSAEVVSLSGSIDRMSWLRLLWEWLKDPSINLASPEEILQKAPQASLVTDCKSAFDISTKTAIPSCSELRTQLECLLLRERLQENCKLRWVHSRAMLADCLTKVMDSAELRKRLSSGRYTLCDEQEVLHDRAEHRQSLKWLRQTADDDSDRSKADHK